MSEQPKQFVDTPDTLYRNGFGQKEVKANNFASRLLMPKDHVMAEARKLLEKEPSKQMGSPAFIKEMAKVFAVSEATMSNRLCQLNIIRKPTWGMKP